MMDTISLTLPRSEARDLYRAYKAHLHYSQPIDDEIRRAFQLIAQGRLIIRAIDSVVQAGLGPDGFPKLALCRADKTACRCDLQATGAGTMYAEGTRLGWNNPQQNSCVIRFPPRSFRNTDHRYSGRALLPLIPVAHRPKRGIANYHVLWEAEWTRVPPRDPMLLRRIGKADMWVVVAAWDLTEIERAAMAGRMAAA